MTTHAIFLEATCALRKSEIHFKNKEPHTANKCKAHQWLKERKKKRKAKQHNILTHE